MREKRKSNGQFAKGHSGGPGRPRRAVERDYMQALSENVSIADWIEIVGAAIEQAKEGDAKARDWVTRYVLGSEPQSLFEIAKMEAIGIAPGHEIDAAAADAIEPPQGDAAVLERLVHGNKPTVLERALKLSESGES